MILSIELKMLLYSVILGFAQLFLVAHMKTKQNGMSWNLSPRDQKTPELTGVGGRLERAFKNFKETFSFFAAAIIIVQITSMGNNVSAIGAQMYFWARLLYVPLYAAGIPGLRSLVWLISLIGIFMVITTAI
jgi:uncharacterized MAPEG superfamily protein